MIKRISAVMAALVLALTVALAGASPAQAAYSACGTNEFCLWSSTDGNGNGWARSPGQLASCTSLVGSSVGNDQAESVRNRTSVGIEIWEHSDCTGTRYLILPYGGATSGYNLGAFPNQTSGVRMRPEQRFYAGVFQTPTAGSEPVGMRSNLDVNSPALDTSGVGHSLVELAAQSADGQQIVEIGWRKTLTSGTAIFVSAWKDDAFLGLGGNGSPNGSGNGFVDYGTNSTTYPGLALSSVAPGPVWQIEHQGTFPNGAWWLGYDGQWLGHYPDSIWNAAPSVTFDEIGLAQWFGEIAVWLDEPCTNMGSGHLPPSASSAKIENTAFYNGSSWSATAPSISSNPNPTAYNTTAVAGTTDDFRFGGGGFC